MTATAGYSGKPLAAKLGLKPGLKLHMIGGPAHYDALVEGWAADTEVAEADILHLFVTDRAGLAVRGPVLAARARLGAALWISWPKKTSPLFVDLTEGGVRNLLLPTGWVDVKVCAVDQDWSALKFLRRRK